MPPISTSARSVTVDGAARAPWRLLPVVLLGNFLAVLDFFVVNVALPSIGRDLHAGPAALELLVAGYAATYACGLVTAGRLGDAYGRRRFFVGGMIAFTVASAACGLAPNAVTLVVARLCQGLAASVMVPQVLATVQALFTGQHRQRALGVFGAVIGLGTVAGQVLGAALVAADVAGLGWRPIFLINVPIGIAGAIAAARMLPDVKSGGTARLDLRGAVLLAATLLLLLLPLSLGRGLGWPVWCWISLAAAVLTAVALAADQLHSERSGGLPLLPPSLLRVGAMRSGLATAAVFFLMCGGFLLTVAITVQDGLGLGPMQAGLVLAPYATGFLLVSLTVRRFVVRFGRAVVVTGAVISAVGLATGSVQAALGYADLTPLRLAPMIALNGVGQAMIMIPLFGLILGGIPAARAGLASGALTTVQQVGLGVGAAALGTLMYSVAGPELSARGWQAGTTAVLAAEAALAVVTAVAAHRLPRA